MYNQCHICCSTFKVTRILEQKIEHETNNHPHHPIHQRQMIPLLNLHLSHQASLFLLESTDNLSTYLKQFYPSWNLTYDCHLMLLYLHWCPHIQRKNCLLVACLQRNQIPK